MGKVAPPMKDTLNVKPPDSTKTNCGTHELQGEVELLGDVILIEDVPISGMIGVVPEPTIDSLKETKALQFAEKMPEFPGGIAEMQKFIEANLRYPDFEKKNNIQGNVYVRFIVEKDGSLSHYEILRDVPLSKNFKNEVFNVLNKMPKWIPGENQGEKQRVYMSLPFTFRIK